MPTPNASTPSSNVELANTNSINSLIGGSKWGSSVGLGANLSYSFYTPGSSSYASNYSSDNENLAAYQLSAPQQTAISQALAAWSAVANINFSPTQDSINNTGDLRFGGYADMDAETAAWAYFPGDAPVCGDVWIGPVTSDPAPSAGSYDNLVFLHEIGHALGLKHSFEQNTDTGNLNVLPTEYEDVRYTVMSYTDNYSYQPTTPMLFDIAAIQYIYGANTQWQTGNNIYQWAPNTAIFETIWDAGGIDTLDASNQAQSVSLNLNSGIFSNIGSQFQNGSSYINNGLAIAYGAAIENAQGSAFNDTLIGNALANILDGRAGIDTLIGGLGNDTYVVDNAADVITETSTLASEIDSVKSSVSWTLGSNLEKLTLTGAAAINGTGNALSNTLTGNAAANIFSGGAGADVLNGGVGADTLIGGLGNDTYVVDNTADVITETSTLVSELDSVQSTVSWTLGANLERLTLTGAAAINGTGNVLSNTLSGNAAANILNGGAGADTLIGGLGNDTYVVDNAADVTTETSTLVSELDSVQSTVSWTLGANLERLTLTGAAAINGFGNVLNNTITGNSAANTLNGGAGADILNGSAGIDTLIGGTGNDLYVVDNSADVVQESSTLAGETDSVWSSTNWTLGNNLENLLLFGTAAVNGSGNVLNNIITGNTAANILNGGAGLDTLTGGLGNDTYAVDNAADVITETSTLTTEIDSVQSSVNWALGSNLEKLTLTGSAAINGTGNALANTLVGNSGANVLTGGGGTDTLTGGAGADRFNFNSLSEIGLGTLRDVITDFIGGSDKIDLSSLDADTLVAGDQAFTLNALNAALTGAHQLSYNITTHILSGSTDADVAAEFEIMLIGVPTFTSAELIG